MQRWLRQVGESNVATLLKEPKAITTYRDRYLNLDALADGLELVSAAAVYHLLRSAEQQLTKSCLGDRLDLLFATYGDPRIEVLTKELTLHQILTIRHGFGDPAYRAIEWVVSQMDKAMISLRLDKAGFSYVLKIVGQADDREFLLKTLSRSISRASSSVWAARRSGN